MVGIEEDENMSWVELVERYTYLSRACQSDLRYYV